LHSSVVNSRCAAATWFDRAALHSPRTRCSRRA
jgi:hypothetical protein